MTDASDLLGQAELILRPWAVDYSHPEANRMDAVIPTEHLKVAVRAIAGAHWGYFAALTGLDLPAPEGGTDEGQIECLYHFCAGAAVLTLRIRVPYSQAQVESLCDIIPSASLYESEFAEMFGVTVSNTTMTTHLLLDDDWPAGVYPMRKSFIRLPAATQTDGEVQGG